MRLKEINLENLICWAEATAWSTDEKVTQLIGFSMEKLEQFCREARSELYPTINEFNEYLQKEPWERLPADQKKFKKLSKQFGEENLLELFFEIGKLLGMREAWQTIINQE
jgi:hypothetical protein